jgi:tetratricopeptide (TPR) repeat protein
MRDEAQSRYAEAEPLLRRSLAIYERTLGPDDPAVATSLNSLARLYHDEGRYAEAEPLVRRSLGIREKALGPGDPALAASQISLATLYQAEGRYAEAEPLLKRALAIIEKTHGSDDAELANNLSRLASLYQDEGRYSEAEPLLKRSLAIREKTFGPDDLDIAISLDNLGAVFLSQGRYSEAEPLLKRSLAIREKTLGPDHPDVAISLNNLAELYRRQGRDAEDEPIYKRCLTLWSQRPDHPDVGNVLVNLAALYIGQRRYAEAEPPLKRSLAIFEKALGPDNPRVATSLGHLATVYYRERRYQEALDTSRRTVAIIGKYLAEQRMPPGTKTGERRQARLYLLNHIDDVHVVGEPNATSESFRVAQLANTSSAAEAVAGMAARFAAGSSALAAVVRERQDLTQRWQRLDAAMVKAASEPPEQRNQAAEGELHQQLAAASTELDVLAARIAREFPQYAELSNPKPLELAEVQALLEPKEAMLVYLVGSDKSWLWALRARSGRILRTSYRGKDACGSGIGTARKSRPNAKQRCKSVRYEAFLRPVRQDRRSSGSLARRRAHNPRRTRRRTRKPSVCGAGQQASNEQPRQTGRLS